MRALFVVLAFALLALSVSACNTVAGFGEDLRQTGAALSKAAD